MTVRQENYRIFLFFAPSFSFPHSEKIVYYFCFQPPLLPPTLKIVYIWFGSMANFTASQLKEITAVLEASRHQFIRVVRRNKKSQEDKEDCLPEGFEERMEGKGLLSEDGHSKF